jgi:hypothetical protein
VILDHTGRLLHVKIDQMPGNSQLGMQNHIKVSPVLSKQYRIFRPAKSNDIRLTFFDQAFSMSWGGNEPADQEKVKEMWSRLTIYINERVKKVFPNDPVVDGETLDFWRIRGIVGNLLTRNNRLLKVRKTC